MGVPRRVGLYTVSFFVSLSEVEGQKKDAVSIPNTKKNLCNVSARTRRMEQAKITD